MDPLWSMYNHGFNGLLILFLFEAQSIYAQLESEPQTLEPGAEILAVLSTILMLVDGKLQVFF